MLILDISNGWKTAIMFVAMIAVFVLFIIRPQKQQAKKEQAYRDSLKKGDEVMTSGGIHGTIASTSASQVQLEVADGVRFVVNKSDVQPLPVRK